MDNVLIYVQYVIYIYSSTVEVGDKFYEDLRIYLLVEILGVWLFRVYVFGKVLYMFNEKLEKIVIV